jgi:hypothetical protein
MTDNTLSPAAQAVLTALTQQEYSLDPDDIPNEAGRMACLAAAALRAAADQVAPEVYFAYTGHGDWDHGMEARNDAIREAILAIATELEAQ